MATPSSDELKDLIRKTKPAFAASGLTNDPVRDSAFKVIHDGRGAWMIERPLQTELLSGGRTILESVHAVEIIDTPAAVNNDVKAALDGKRLAYLDDGVLELIGTATVAERPCFRVRAWGLKKRDDRPFEFAVDTETGSILRMEGGSGTLLEVTDFRVAEPPADAAG